MAERLRLRHALLFSQRVSGNAGHRQQFKIALCLLVAVFMLVDL